MQDVFQALARQGVRKGLKATPQSVFLEKQSNENPPLRCQV